MQNLDPQPRIPDRELLKEAQSPDEATARRAFTAIWQRYEPRLREWVSPNLGDRRGETPDVLGNLARDFWKRLRTPPPLEIIASTLWPYLKDAAHNQVVSQLTRHAKPLAGTSLDALTEDHPAALLDPAAEVPNDEARFRACSLLLLSPRAQSSALLLESISMSPEQVSAEQARAAEWLRDYGSTCFMEALRQLPPTDRDVLILRRCFKLSSCVVGEILDLTESAVNQRIWRATRQLHDIYASMLYDKGTSLAQIWQKLAAFERLKPTLEDDGMDERTRARRVSEFIESGVKLRGKTKE